MALKQLGLFHWFSDYYGLYFEEITQKAIKTLFSN